MIFSEIREEQALAPWLFGSSFVAKANNEVVGARDF